ncbi:hypothetical protein AB1Y20_012585 [Prymnesium parvum]|uniref:Suppressor of white apricot N-terminal domain-containing protein n=1 Tax=Prymnesium parvum TaxID=97485 RepID=A0AB34IKY9_PRYPA
MKRPREDPSSPELIALGYAVTLFDDPLLSAKQQAAHLQTHPHDAELTLDRYDARLLLDGVELTHAAAPSASASASTAKVEAEGGAEVEAERWAALAEAEALEGAQQEAEAARQREAEETERRLKQAREAEETERRLKQAREAEETERRLKQAREVPPLLRRVVDFVCAQPSPHHHRARPLLPPTLHHAPPLLLITPRTTHRHATICPFLQHRRHRFQHSPSHLHSLHLALLTHCCDDTQPAHERELVEQALRDSAGGAVRFGFLFSGQPQHALYTALRDGTPLPSIKAKEEIQAERRQRAKMLAAQLML